MNNYTRWTRRDALAAMSAVALAPAALATPARRPWTTVQATLDEFVRERSVPGAGMAIAYGSAAPWYPAAGTIAFSIARRFDADSICRIYSMTKHVTRIAALLLVEDGTLTLDQPRRCCRSSHGCASPSISRGASTAVRLRRR